ncbi:MAG: aminotransferase class IV family protein [Euryarchaeota archaeon]|nr:aminotransferase class IV family protein [Euryarchaeota archaeon]
MSRVFVDGSEAKAASLPLLNRGLYYGDAVYETFKTREGRVFRLNRHLRRLEEAAAFLGLEAQPMSQHLDRTARFIERETKGQDSVVRLTLLRPGEGRGLVPLAGMGAHVVIEVSPAGASPDRRAGIDCITSTVRRVNPYPGRPQIKSTSAQPLVTARREASLRHAYEAIMLNGAGMVAEGSFTNVFVVREGRVSTPGVESDVLPGITREAIIETAKACGVKVDEGEMRPEALRGADELFLTNAVIGVVPVARLDGDVVGAFAPGPITAKLAESFDALVEREWRGGRPSLSRGPDQKRMIK